MYDKIIKRMNDIIEDYENGLIVKGVAIDWLYDLRTTIFEMRMCEIISWKMQEKIDNVLERNIHNLYTNNI